MMLYRFCVCFWITINILNNLIQSETFPAAVAIVPDLLIPFLPHSLDPDQEQPSGPFLQIYLLPVAVWEPHWGGLRDSYTAQSLLVSQRAVQWPNEAHMLTQSLK